MVASFSVWVENTLLEQKRYLVMWLLQNCMLGGNIQLKAKNDLPVLWCDSEKYV